DHDLTALPAPGMHLQVRVFAEASDLHEWRAIPKPQPQLGSAVRTPPPRAGDQRLQFVRRRSAAKRLPEVDAVLGVETQVPHAVGREPATIAARAERLGRRRDDAEDGAVGERVTVGRGRALFDDRLDPSIAPAERLEPPDA